MARDDWFRCTSWSAEEQELFEAKLARSRTPFHRAQYLRIQGLTLLETRDRRWVEAGRELSRRVIADYPEEVMQVVGAHSALGKSFVDDGEYDVAIDHFRACLELEAGRSFQHGAELDLAEALIAAGDTSSLDEAWELLDTAHLQAVFGIQRWRIEVARARLFELLAQRTRAAEHAKAALELLEGDEPTFPRHPTVGLIRTDEATVEEMRSLAAGRVAATRSLAARIRRLRQS